MLTAADQADTPKVEERNKDSTNFARFLNHFFLLVGMTFCNSGSGPKQGLSRPGAANWMKHEK